FVRAVPFDCAQGRLYGTLNIINASPALKSLCENCAAPLALDNSVPLSPALPRWANEFRRSAAGFWVRLDHCASRK
ncbi:MAG: hypothetical protein WCC59_18285, partial [Terriglobales bacterium]